ncbi:MAG: hypothetical protein DYH02_04240, partial [Candidatus Omnitrophica bacterium COP1]|nr:hypothetical protein [Candidatus Omnitrophica bacterium COP1]
MMANLLGFDFSLARPGRGFAKSENSRERREWAVCSQLHGQHLCVEFHLAITIEVRGGGTTNFSSSIEGDIGDFASRPFNLTAKAHLQFINPCTGKLTTKSAIEIGGITDAAQIDFLDRRGDRVIF